MNYEILLASIGPTLVGIAAILQVRRLRNENREQHKDNSQGLQYLLLAHAEQDAENFAEIHAELRSTNRELRGIRKTLREWDEPE